MTPVSTSVNSLVIPRLAWLVADHITPLEFEEQYHRHVTLVEQRLQEKLTLH